MITRKTVYKVPDILDDYAGFSGLFSTPVGIWCTDNFECRNMSMKDAKKNSKCISGCFIDEGIKDCLIFTFFDPVNYSVDKDMFIEISYEDLLEDFCKEIIMFVV